MIDFCFIFIKVVDNFTCYITCVSPVSVFPVSMFLVPVHPDPGVLHSHSHLKHHPKHQQHPEQGQGQDWGRIEAPEVEWQPGKNHGHYLRVHVVRGLQQICPGCGEWDGECSTCVGHGGSGGGGWQWWMDLEIQGVQAGHLRQHFPIQIDPS
jgi:hypothetical protein